MTAKKHGQHPLNHAHMGDEYLKISAMNLPRELCGVLEIIRVICTAYSSATPESLRVANDVAEAWFGPTLGKITFRSTAQLLRTLRQNRQSPFRFSNPACPVCRDYVTPHEQLLMKMVHSVMCSDVAKARSAAIILCEGNDEFDLIETTKNLAIVCRTEKTTYEHVLDFYQAKRLQ
jgi:hypothetical protein